MEFDFWGNPKDPSKIRQIITDYQMEDFGHASVVYQMQELVDGRWVNIKQPTSGCTLVVLTVFIMGFIVWGLIYASK